MDYLNIAYLRGKRYENEKKIVTNEKGVNQHTNEVNHQNDAQPKTSEASPQVGNLAKPPKIKYAKCILEG